MKNLILIAVIFSVLFLAGCPDVPNPPSEKTGKLSLSITDKKVEGLEELHVTISSIEVHMPEMAMSDDTNSDQNSDSMDSGWITFSEEEQTFDLMQLDSTQGLKAVLGEKELNAGKYTQIRLSVKEVKAVINGEEFDVEVSSDKIKLVRSFNITENQTTELIIDFSPESVIKSGNTYKLKPVIKLLVPKEFRERQQEQKMTQEKAMELAQAEDSECIQQGSLGENASYNENTKTWWIDFTPDTPKENCNPACVVSSDETVEINWMCTGLIEQSFCESDSDCACGTNTETGRCFYGNKNFVEAPECADYCSGEAGHLEIKCVDNTCVQVQKQEQEQQGTGMFTLLISDKEADITDFESVVVSFDKARIFRSDSNSGFTEADLNNSSVDLTTVIGELAVPLVELELSAGTYTKIELHVSGVTAVLADGNSAEVTVPSNKLMITKNFSVDANSETKFVFDIQVVKKGNTNTYNLLPVISKSGVIGKDLNEDEVEEIEPEEEEEEPQAECGNEVCEADLGETTESCEQDCPAEPEITVDDSTFLDDVCDANTSCPTGYECAGFPNEVGLKCYPLDGTESVCDFVSCPAGFECIIAESYPVQISCSEITE